jgi:hypothetical protein
MNHCSGREKNVEMRGNHVLCATKKMKAGVNYFGTTTVTISAVFVKNMNSFEIKNFHQLQNVLTVNKQKDASKCVTVAKSSCALGATIISKLIFN